MSTHTVVRPADEALPTPSAPDFERVTHTCPACLCSFAIWKWADAEVVVEHTVKHIERHGPRGAART